MDGEVSHVIRLIVKGPQHDTLHGSSAVVDAVYLAEIVIDAADDQGDRSLIFYFD